MWMYFEGLSLGLNCVLALLACLGAERLRYDRRLENIEHKAAMLNVKELKDATVDLLELLESKDKQGTDGSLE